MKKKLLFVLFLFAIMVTAIGCSNTTDQSLKDDEIVITEEKGNSGEEKKVLRIGTPGQHYPWNFFEAGQLKGADIETIQEICRRIGYEAKFDIIAFEGLYGSIDTNRIDTGA